VRRKKARRSPSLMSTRALQPSHASRRIGGGSIDRWGGGGGGGGGGGVGVGEKTKPERSERELELGTKRSESQGLSNNMRAAN
jgi:hypothetical protein